MPSVVMFDVDGTLLDHDGAVRAGVVGWLTGKRLATSQECEARLITLWDEVAERHFPAFRAREISFQEQRRRRLREFLPHVNVAVDDMDDADLDGMFEDYLAHYEAAWCVFDDVVPCLDALQGIRLAVLTNGDKSQQEDKLRRTRIAARFDAVLTSDELGVAKPYPEAYRMACGRLGVDPASVLYVGDRVDVDAEAATAAGLVGVWLNRHASSTHPFRPMITTLAELPALFNDQCHATQPPDLPL